MSITIKTEAEIKILRKAGKILATILNALEKEVVVGNSSLDVDDKAMELIATHGAEPVLLGYHPRFAPRPYPAATCVSVNDVVVHGIPNEHPHEFVDGDVVSIDLAISYQGLVVDSARTIVCGEGSAEDVALLKVTKEALTAGIKAAKDGAHVRDIGAAVSGAVPEGYGVVEVLCGHGVGYAVHEPPEVPNYVVPGESPVLREGMVLAIEPMIIAGKKDVIFDEKDGYTVLSADGHNAAHMEHTVLITKKGPEILTII